MPSFRPWCSRPALPVGRAFPAPPRSPRVSLRSPRASCWRASRRSSLATAGWPGRPWLHTIRKPGGGEPSNAAWGPGWTSDHLVKIDIETHEVTLYPFPHRDVGAYQSVVDLEGILWTVFTNADAVGRFDPETEEWTCTTCRPWAPSRMGCRWSP